MFSTPADLFNGWDPATQGNDPMIQEVVLYCASRLRAIVLATLEQDDVGWIMDTMLIELVCDLVTLRRAPRMSFSRD
jgi:hypothetical protein